NNGSVSYSPMIWGMQASAASSRASGRLQRSRARRSMKPPGLAMGEVCTPTRKEAPQRAGQAGNTAKATATSTRPPIAALRLGNAANKAAPTDGLAASSHESEGSTAAADSRGDH